MLMSSPSTSLLQLRRAAEARTTQTKASVVLVATRHYRRSRSLGAKMVPRASSGGGEGVVEPGALVLVAGATGGVGQLVTAKLLEVRRCSHT